jgi:hypothetical protein
MGRQKQGLEVAIVSNMLPAHFSPASYHGKGIKID